MLKYLFLFVSFFATLTLAAQEQVYPTLLAPLPTLISESSGIECNGLNNIWTHNDSGDLPRIFQIDTLGNLLRTLDLSEVVASDMEDMAQDSAGNYYLGDFGNNLNDRTDLRIYKIPNPDSVSGNFVTPQVIHFNYPDQMAFPPALEDQNFDCEAMFHFRDSLYLFSKNRGTSNFCKLYRLPDQPGNYTAQLIDSFDTRKWITSADISPSGKSMVLLSYDRLWLFTDFQGTDFFGGKAQELLISPTQKEAIVFRNETEVYITDELYLFVGGKLYFLDLGPWIVGLREYPSASKSFRLFPNPVNNLLSVEHTCSSAEKAIIQFISTKGQTVKEEKIQFQTGRNEIHIPVEQQFNGLYFVRIIIDDKYVFSTALMILHNQ